MRKNGAFVAKIVITHLTKGFMAMFAPAESLPSPATLALSSLSLCSLDLNPIGQLTALAQVAAEQKRLDARIQWLAAFSQVGPQSTLDFS